MFIGSIVIVGFKSYWNVLKKVFIPYIVSLYFVEKSYLIKIKKKNYLRPFIQSIQIKNTKRDSNSQPSVPKTDALTIRPLALWCFYMIIETANYAAQMSFEIDQTGRPKN